MSLPRYPKYKPSGVEWLGYVPEHWEVRRLKSVCRFYGGGTPARDTPRYWNGGIPWVSPKDMKTEAIEATEETISEEGVAASAATVLEAGHALIVVRSGILQHTIPVAINSLPVAVNQDIRALRFNIDLCDAKYFVRWVQGLNDRLLPTWAKQGATVESIEHDLLANSMICAPPASERAFIAAFLDRETAKIDGLVAEQQRLIELLKEKRHAVISHVVTKGLDARAPMYPSGVEWLGDMPAHWKVYKLGRLGRFRAGAGFPDIHQGQRDLPIPFFKVGDLNRADSRGAMIDAQHTVTTETVAALRAAVFPPSVIVFAKVGAALLLRRFRWLDRPACIDNNMMGFELSPAADLRFTLYRLPSIDLCRIANPGAVPSINERQLSELRLALPPLPEQRAIASFLDQEMAKIDGLVAEVESAITLLQERRAALISAAVTGQIDVRNAVATKAA